VQEIYKYTINQMLLDHEMVQILLMLIDKCTAHMPMDSTTYEKKVGFYMKVE
jgi:hypothetical protein